MKAVIYLSLIFLIIWPNLAGAEKQPFSIVSYGHFKKMVHMKKTKGVAFLTKALVGTNIYAVGAIADGRGEITVIDGEIWLNYGQDGLGPAVKDVKPDEQAVLLVTAQVPKWRDVIVPHDMTRGEFEKFVVDAAAKAGLNSAQPFPFILSGEFKNLDWHVINGQNSHFQGHGQKGAGFFNQHRESLTQASAEIIGFYSAQNTGVYTHPGESFHLHVVFKPENRAGHVDGYSISKRTTLKLPVSL